MDPGGRGCGFKIVDNSFNAEGLSTKMNRQPRPPGVIKGEDMFKVAAIFSDRMVLQRNKRIAVFGEGEPGKTVTALCYKNEGDIADNEGVWLDEEAECPGCAGCSGCNGCTGCSGDIKPEITSDDASAKSYIDEQDKACDSDSAYELVSEIMVDYAETKVDRNGKWILYLPEQKAGTDYVLEVYSGDDSKMFTDVAIGEVYLAGGQSNMELELQTCFEWPQVEQEIEALQKLKSDELKNRQEGGSETEEADVSAQSAAVPDIRFYYTQKRSYIDEKFLRDEENTSWAKFGDEGTKAWSAVAYFFAKKLSEKIDCPIGIIGCNWGGTSASCWVSRETLVESLKTKPYVDEYNASPYILESEEEQIREYEEYLEKQSEWDRKCGELFKENPGISFEEVEAKIGKCLYPGPLNCASPQRPAGLYETMLKRVCPYSLKGFIFYQGETDEGRPDSYYTLMTALIRQWRNDWGDDTLPFILTQLTMHRYNGAPDNKSWCIIREAQMKVRDTVRNTGIAVIIDQGEFSEIHPKRKQKVGERLALQAFAEIYGIKKLSEASGPVYDSCVFKEGGVELRFRNCDHGFAVRCRDYGDEPWKREKNMVPKGSFIEVSTAVASCFPLGFEIAGEDGNFVQADATLAGNRIFVFSENVSDPRYVRYLWTNYSEVNLFGGANEDGEYLPVAPFRT